MFAGPRKLFNHILTFNRLLKNVTSSRGLKYVSHDLRTIKYPIIPQPFLPIKTEQFQFAKYEPIQEIPINKIIIENPLATVLNEIQDIIKNHKVIDEPKSKQTEIQMARLIVIRRRKMKKHKLKKLRKKMKFEWAKVRQRREMRKEKAFQAELISQIKMAEKFSAMEYVEEKLRKADEIPISRYWKGRRLPQFIIKEKLGIK